MIGALLALVAVAEADQTALGRLQRGDLFPSLEVIEDEHSKTLADYPGVRVVEFWATWCGPCIAAAPQIDAFARQHSDRVTVLSVCTDYTDNRREAERLAGKHADNYPLVSPTKTTMDSFSKVPGGYTIEVPQFFVITEDGRLYRQFSGIKRKHAQYLARQVTKAARWQAQNPQ